ncbi:MAG: hypothetical protein U5L06_03965 [Rhodovibrio sp.]|nr:hypothetical protein [Rhodovibrio sp.]
MWMRSMVAAFAGLLVLGVSGAPPAAASDRYTDHVVAEFEKSALRAFDPLKRVPVEKVRVQQIIQKPGKGGKIVELRAVDDLVCLKLKPGAGREEACVLAADLSPCVCDYAVRDVAQKQSDIGGLSGVVSPNGGACACE